jgi:uncharacterized protein (DUF608 family)
MIYKKKELYQSSREKVYQDDFLNEIAFPIGGIGAGCISLSGRGELVDWEIFGRPNKNFHPRHSFFCLWARREDEEPIFRILESRHLPSYSRHNTRYDASGSAPWGGSTPGLPRMQKARFTSRFPFAQIRFQDQALPLEVSLEGFNPFIPLKEDDSSLPVAMFLIHLKNPGRKRVKATVAFSLENIIGYMPPGSASMGKPAASPGRCINQFRQESVLSGVFLKSGKFPENSPQFGSLAIGTSWKDLTFQTPWYRAGWWDGLQHFCNTFLKTGEFENNTDSSPSGENATDIVSLGLKADLAAGEELVLPFVLSWHFPWFEQYWQQGSCREGESCAPPKWRNYYATIFKDAWDVAKYCVQNLEELYEESQEFSNALYESSLPGHAIESIANNLSILKTPTCLRLEDGSFYGFEGCISTGGCCEGTCTHVWNYALALCRLFPRLERSLRENELKYSVREEDGHMQFRMPLPPGEPAKHDFHAAVDGQLGTILKVYREYLVCGDKEWLQRMWPAARKALEYAWKEWDPDRDGMIDGLHHNTYDIEFIGAEPLANSFYLAALRAAEQIALIVGETEKAKEYNRIYKRGARKMDKILFNGEYYRQKIKDINAHKYQFGEGCLSDQLIGQWYADMLGLGNLTNSENIHKALRSIFQYNWKESFAEFPNPQRVYAMNDEKGLVLCTWPRGKRPLFPFPYSDEVWYGIEYQVACCLIHHGFVDEGLAIVKGIRERHNGKNRNPWNEVECGNHYARSLASYGLLQALSGFYHAAPEKRIQFAPRINEKNFQCVFSQEGSWGIFQQKLERKGGWEIRLTIKSGALELKEIILGMRLKETGARFFAGEDRIGARIVTREEGSKITFPRSIKLDCAKSLVMCLQSPIK